MCNNMYTLCLTLVWHVPICCTRSVYLVYTTPNIRATKLLLTVNTFLCQDPLILFNSPIKLHALSTLIRYIKVVIYFISANMASLVQTRKYGAINSADPTTLGFFCELCIRYLHTAVRYYNVCSGQYVRCTGIQSRIPKHYEILKIGIGNKTEINRLSLYQPVPFSIHVYMCQK